jgi:hypothetical protein
LTLEDKTFRISNSRLKCLNTDEFRNVTDDALVQYLESLRQRFAVVPEANK